MSIEGFDIKDQWLGTGDKLAYTFDFKISSLTDLLIYVQDGGGNVVEEIRGDDTTYLSGVVFDPIKGGGTITLLVDLPDTYVMTVFLANDLPQQPTSFPNKLSFSLGALEGGLDYLGGAIQRLAWLAQRSIAMHDLDDIDNFDPTLPIGIANYAGSVLGVNAAGTAFQMIGSTNLPIFSGDPANPTQGYAYVNTTIPAIRVYINGAWKSAALS